MTSADLPVGSAPKPVPVPHFPDRLHAFVWRNWQLVPAARMAEVVGGTREQIVRMGRSMGLEGPPRITANQIGRSYITVIRRNWHLLPYDQLLTLLGWSAEHLAFVLREDDFLYIKLGSHKPAADALRWTAPTPEVRQRERQIAAIVREHFPAGVGKPDDPLFAFVSRLASDRGTSRTSATRTLPSAGIRYCYSYFAPYGDPLMDGASDPYPDGYLRSLAAAGVNGVWLQGVLSKLAPYPFDPPAAQGHETRLANLRRLIARAKRHGIGIYLYLNEPRALPLAKYGAQPDVKGVVEGDHAALCVSAPEVRSWLSSAVEHIAREAPGLSAMFTITASENLSNCWSHNGGSGCPRCAKRTPAEVVAEPNIAIAEGLARAGTGTMLIAWDWGWADEWVEPIIKRLPAGTAFMSVSEWSLPIRRGGIETTVGEYSLSAVGPGPRAKRNWAIAQAHGLRVLAKIQANCTWELSSVPYIPAVSLTARHAARLHEYGVRDLMLGWTLGGYPSPNLAAVAAAESGSAADQIVLKVARDRFGDAIGPSVARVWESLSTAFQEYPYHIGAVYSGPQQMGPANLLYADPTGYAATMVGFPYDDLDAWRAVYPADVYADQMAKTAVGFAAGAKELANLAAGGAVPHLTKQRLIEEARVTEAVALHLRSTSNQAKYVAMRRSGGADDAGASRRRAAIELVLRQEIADAVTMHRLQSEDSRLGFEASNHYFFVPVDLAEKVVSCRFLLDATPARLTSP